MPTSQQSRSVAVDSPLGDGVLLFQSLQLTEALGRPFQGELYVMSEDHGIDFSKIVGQNVTVHLTDVTGSYTRYINGFVSRFAQTGQRDEFALYRATIVPWLWFLTRTADCRIFQTMSVPDIVKKIFRDRGFSDFKDTLSGSYNPWDYCVQYRESDFNFISRLLEHEGIYYYFEHDNGKHTLVLADGIGSHSATRPYDTIQYRPDPVGGGVKDECIHEWTLEQQLQPGVYTLNDFDFTAPKKSLVATSQVQRQNTQADFEVYDYPGEYTAAADGDTYARVRIEELQSQFEIVRAGTDCTGLTTGALFTLQDHSRDDQNREYLVTFAQYQIGKETYRSGQDDEGLRYSCQFTAIDSKQQFRPPRVTAKPVIQGPQTAIVAGPSGEEIYTDPYGRVKLQFLWDRDSQADENSSCWVRVAQVWAGRQWGGIFIPRKGQEVVVEFLEGDPDQPIVTGRVYNGDNKPPYDLPANATMSTVKSNSSKGGGGFNEIRLEDKKGSEMIFIHGEKDQDIRIKNDCLEWIGHDRHLHIVNSQFEHIELDRDETIDRDHVEQIGRDRNTTITGKEAKSVGGSFSLEVTGDVAEVFSAGHSMQVTNDCYVKADNIVIEAMTNVTIKVGQSYIAIESGGISIGTSGSIDLTSTGDTSIAATGKFAVQSQEEADVQAPQVSVQGQAMLTLKGGMVMIN